MTIHPMEEEAFQTIDASMFSGCPDEEFLQRLEYFMARWGRQVPVIRAINAEVEADLADDDEDDIMGNDCTGDITAVWDYMDYLEFGNDNWIKGTKGKFKICAKVFGEGSTYGIKNGRISKLQICDGAQEHWGFDQCYVNYDRGWDIRPTDSEALEFLNGLLEAFGDDPMTDMDLQWYDLFGYETEEDFENGDREHLGSFDFKDDAISEAKCYLEEGEHVVMKVISNDDEDAEIIRVEKTA